MKSRILPLALLAIALPLSALAAEPGHDHHGASSAQLQMNAGQKWATDASLRKGMDAMRAKVAPAVPAAHAGKLKPAQYDALARELNGQVAYIVQNCKLDPKADAQLHIVIGDLAEGIETMEGKRQGSAREQGLVRVTKALNAYGQHFDHPNWKPVGLPH